MEKSIKQTLQEWENDELNIRSLWYDWFCKDTSLHNKGLALLRKLKAISKSSKFDNDKTCVVFKNNCPLNGRLYDDFRICDIESGDVIYTIIPSSGHNFNKGRAELWGRDNDFKEAIVEGTWKDIKAWFLGE